ncbi:hypothetical protein TEA_001549 [Camellia sinensis var. sinensis]|uniref:Mediator complex subunit 23 n=1 Tax=Camellia sinensis var. sinensis TaxID=542762 RepID=A0A4S4D1Q5_CAMSN|nr:hypothetical protein TEA_001549 [Camellia sinensis var. sinensis]
MPKVGLDNGTFDEFPSGSNSWSVHYSNSTLNLTHSVFSFQPQSVVYLLDYKQAFYQRFAVLVEIMEVVACGLVIYASFPRMEVFVLLIDFSVFYSSIPFIWNEEKKVNGVGLGTRAFTPTLPPSHPRFDSLLLQRAGFNIPYLGYHLLHWALKHYFGDRMMDYMNLDDRSIGMFWVVSYTMAQPACETVMNWLTSAGVQELLPGSNLQSTERLMVMREHLSQRNPAILKQPGPSLLVLEILNYRLLSLYRRLLIVFLKLVEFYAFNDGRIDVLKVMNLVNCYDHTYSKPYPISPEHSETTVIKQCTQLLSPSADPTYAMTYISHSFPMHRDYLCAGAWVLMHVHPENINSANLGCVLREFSPEEVTANIYKMVDVLLHHIHLELQHGHSLQELILKASTNLAYFVWTNELLPLDILLLALIDRDDDPHALRIVEARTKPHIFSLSGLVLFTPWTRKSLILPSSPTLQDLKSTTAIINRILRSCSKHPTFFDDITARLLPVIPLIIYRLIENDATDFADRVLQLFSTFLHYYPLNFTFVRDILSYFYGHLPGKLILRILNVLDLKKIPFSESFPQHINSSNAAICPPLDYFATLLLGIVNNVIPPLNNSSKTVSLGDASSNSLRAHKNSATSQPGPTNASEGQKAFYQIQDPGTHTQLMLETAVIEILSLPVSASQIVSSLVQIVVHIQPTLIQSSNGLHGAPNSVGQGSVLPTSPSGGSTDSLNASRPTPSVSGINTSNFVSRSGYTCQQLSCLLIQACGLLLAQLPTDFHIQLYMEASRLIKESWWLTDGKRSLGELDSAVGYALLDPTWAAQDNTSTAIGNIVALLHSFFSNLPQEWLDGTHLIIKHLRPVTSVAVLRIVFRIMGPLLPRLANAHALFNKTLSLLLNIMVDVFGKNSQLSTPVEASDIADLIDFLYHVVHYEGQGGPVQANSKPRYEVLALCGRALENLRPDVQHLLSHLKTDINSSIYAATHPKLVQNPL